VIAGTDNGSTSITFVAEYSKRSPIFDADRDYTAPWIRDDGDGRTDIYNDTDGISYYGKTVALYDPNTKHDDMQAANNCPTDGGFYGVMGALAFGEPDGTVCAYGYAGVSANKAGLDKLSTYGSLSHSFSENVEFFATALISKVESFGRYAPPAARWPNMPADYKDVPYDIDALIADGTITKDYVLTGYYRWTNIGPRDGEVTDSLHDFVAGFRGDIGDGVSYEIYTQRSRYDSKDLGKYFLSYPGLDYVLSEGIDPFSAEGAGAMSALPVQDNRTDMEKIYGHVQFGLGDLFRAGETIVLVGAEVISVDYVNEYDRASENGFIGGSAGNSSAGDRDIKALFAEMLIPAHEKVEVNFALRYDDYSDFGSSVSPSLSGTYEVT
jgi:iron complex outermembrane receptor protein